MLKGLFGGNGRFNGIRTQAHSEGTVAASYTPPADGGKLIVLTAPLTETIDHAGYFIQMAIASLPIWMEIGMTTSIPPGARWSTTPMVRRATCRAGVRLVEKSLLREFRPEDIVVCYPDDLDKFLGPRTRVVGVSTHNPLGVTFAAGVYTLMFGSSKEPIILDHAKLMFAKIKNNPFRQNFKVIVGGSAGWHIQTDSFEALSVDCVVEGRSESQDAVTFSTKPYAVRPCPASRKSYGRGCRPPAGRGSPAWSEMRLNIFPTVAAVTGRPRPRRRTCAGMGRTACGIPGRSRSGPG